MKWRTGLAVGLALLAALAGARSSETSPDDIENDADPAAPLLTVEADRGSLRIGEPVHLTLEVVAPVGVEVELPGPGSDWGAFELLDRQLLPPDSLATGGVRHAARLTVTTYEAGSATLPPLAALLRAEGGRVRAVHSDSLTLGVESVLPAAGADTADIRPLKPAMELAGRRPWWPLLAALLALLLALGVWIVIRHRRRQHPNDAAVHQLQGQCFPRL